MTAEERIKVIENVRTWGGPISDAIFNPGCQVFRFPTIEGVIGYHLTPSCAIVMGDPICKIENRPTLVNAFHQFCQEKKLTVIYLVTSKGFTDWAMQNVCQACIEFGEELTMNPNDDPRKKTGSQAVLIRKKTKQALSNGTTVQEYIPYQPELEQEMEKVGEAWLKGRTGAQIYVSPITLFTDQPGKRWFYAQKENQIVGVAALHQLQARQGWLLNHMLTTPEAANGTSELLISSVIEKLAQDNYSHLTFGIVPGNELGEIKGLGKFSSWAGRLAFKAAQKFFHLKGRKKFWEKFQPNCEPSYILFSQPSIKITEMIGLFRALNAAR